VYFTDIGIGYHISVYFTRLVPGTVAAGDEFFHKFFENK
jgi:hypothetical protein